MAPPRIATQPQTAARLHQLSEAAQALSVAITTIDMNVSVISVDEIQGLLTLASKEHASLGRAISSLELQLEREYAAIAALVPEPPVEPTPEPPYEPPAEPVFTFPDPETGWSPGDPLIQPGENDTGSRVPDTK